MLYSKVILATLLALPLSYAQQAADGLIVPFTSKLPVCASKCGPLYDVQGGCTPPKLASVDSNCFCSDGRLSAFGGEGTSGVSSICGAAACPSATDLQAIKSWYQGFCANKAAAPTTTQVGGAAGTSTSTSKPTSTSKNSGSQGSSDDDENAPWFKRHWKWVVMIVVVVIGIIVIWVGAWFLRKRHLRKKEKEFEMGAPVSWGPNHTGGAGAAYTDGVTDGRSNAGGAGGHHKEASAMATPANGSRLKKQKMGWFKSAKI